MTIKLELMDIKCNLLQFKTPTLNLWGGIGQKNAKLSEQSGITQIVPVGKIAPSSMGDVAGGNTRTKER